MSLVGSGLVVGIRLWVVWGLLLVILGLVWLLWLVVCYCLLFIGGVSVMPIVVCCRFDLWLVLLFD